MRIGPTTNYTNVEKLTRKEKRNLSGSIGSLERAGLTVTEKCIQDLAESIISRRRDGSGTSASGGMGGGIH